MCYHPGCMCSCDSLYIDSERGRNKQTQREREGIGECKYVCVHIWRSEVNIKHLFQLLSILFLYLLSVYLFCNVYECLCAYMSVYCVLAWYLQGHEKVLIPWSQSYRSL